ncbi:MAG: hypothetical protein FD167_3201 [bacterium]|nr:MAG: hypothetical protein FD167_3201 [bacterium]
MDTIIKLIPAILKSSGNNEELCEKSSFIAWKIAAGKHLAQVTFPKRLIKKTLRVAVLDESWKKELEKFSPQLLFQINTILGTPLVTTFDFYVDSKEIAPKAALENTPTIEDIPVDPVVLKSAQVITDNELRTKFLATASRYLVAQENRKKQQKEKEDLIK